MKDELTAARIERESSVEELGDSQRELENTREERDQLHLQVHTRVGLLL